MTNESDPDTGVRLPSEALLRIAETSEVEAFGLLRVVHDGLPPLAVAYAQGEFFVIDDTCSHGAASLSEGAVKDGAIECPWHSGTFCLRTGQALTFPAVVPIKAYRSVVIDGHVCIEAGETDRHRPGEPIPA
jgi:nitrite reductase/ring-hydroxylating ferredoxin subunit